MSDLVTLALSFFFVAVAIGACALVGSMLFDLLPVLRSGDDRTRVPLVFPEVARRPAVREPARVYRITPQSHRVLQPIPLRAAA